MRRMLFAKPFRHHQLDPLTDELVTRVAKELLRLRVDQQDPTFAIDNHHRVRCGLEEAAELLFRFFPFGDVADGGRHERAVLGFKWAQADLDRKLRTVLAQAVQLET